MLRTYKNGGTGGSGDGGGSGGGGGGVFPVNPQGSNSVLADSGTYSNGTAVGDITLTLPAAVADKVVNLIVKAAHYLKALCAGSDVIIYGPSGTDVYVRSNELNATITLQCFAAGEWNVVNQPMGYWTLGS